MEKNVYVPNVDEQRGAQRSQLHTEPGCEFVERNEFVGLVLSNKKMERSDVSNAGLYGLFDPVSGKQFLIEDEKLFEEDPAPPVPPRIQAPDKSAKASSNKVRKDRKTKRAHKWIEGTTPDQPISQVARCALAVRLGDVLFFLALAAKKPNKNVEYVHQLRVATRRVMAAFHVFDSVLPSCRVRKIKKQLRRVRRAASDARDLDVLLQRLVGEKEAARKGMKQAIKKVRSQRKDAQKPLVKIHRRLNREHLKCETESLLRRVSWRSENKEPSFAQAANTVLRSIVDEFFVAAGADLSDINALHRMRICGKQLRYAMELLAGGFDKSLGDDLYPLFVEVQDRLGEINDHAAAGQRFKQWVKQSRGGQRKAFRRLRKSESKQLALKAEQFTQWWTSERAANLKHRFDKLLSKSPEVQTATGQEKKKLGAHIIGTQSSCDDR